ncbi:deoxynucleoside kinase [Taibaiella helva]|uniref:deoxynucleoside kinase n=1 Tax=Taibaiella helva TaxID=2301235 RepID=UPI000E581ADC|nr:deoxynucleoside kinase [Taibaiella helva]
MPAVVKEKQAPDQQGFKKRVYLYRMEYHFIAIEGNIGAGKTTLAHKLAQHYNARLILEQFADNPFLPRFYEDKERYAFPVELSFLAERYSQLKDTLLNRELFQQMIVADYTIIKSQLFARNNLGPDEYELFQRMAEIIRTQLPRPDLLIYLHSPIAKLQQQIHQRGRPYEAQIADEYLQEIQEAYMQYLSHEEGPILMIDTTWTDFNKAEHFAQLTDFLESGETFERRSLFIK